MQTSMKKHFTVLILCVLAQSVFAQLFVEAGVNAQFLRIARKESNGLDAMAELITASGGNPNSTLPKIIKSRVIAPKISIGYRIPFEDFNLLISAGTSQDWGNSWKLRGTAAVAGKTYPYPECFSVRIRAYQTWETGLSIGAETVYDNQKSETILNGSDLSPKVKGLLNQISSEINLLGSGSTQYMQLNGVVGWQKTKDKLDFGIYGLVGLVGNAIGVQMDFKVRYYFREKG
jgi:hypothetical protein